MNINGEFDDVYEDVIIDNTVIKNVLVRKHRSGRNIYINHPDSIQKIEQELKKMILKK